MGLVATESNSSYLKVVESLASVENSFERVERLEPEEIKLLVPHIILLFVKFAPYLVRIILGLRKY